MSDIVVLMEGGPLVGPAPEIEHDPENYRFRVRNQDGSWGPWIVSPPGSPGPSPAIGIGNVTPVAYGTAPAVSVTGTSPNFQLHFDLPVSERGISGGGVTARYTNSLATSAPPDSGQIRFNAIPIASANLIYLHDTTADGLGFASVNASLGGSTSTNKGQIRFVVDTDPTRWALYNITGIAVQTGYVTLTVAYIAGSGNFAAGEVLIYTFSRTGDGGAVNVSTLPSGSILKRDRATFTTYIGHGFVIPSDNTKPTSSEGVLLMSLTLAATLAASRIRIRGALYASNSTAPATNVASVYVDSAVDPIGSAPIQANSNSLFVLPFDFEYLPGDTASHTYKLRIGSDDGLIYLNGRPGTPLYGGAMACWMVVEEIKA